MGEHDVKPSEQRGGTTPGEAEVREKGEWVGAASDGIVPPELGGSDAPPDERDPGPVGAALGETTGSDAPATETGIDRSAGDSADAVTDGGPERSGDLKDAAAMPRQVDADSAR